jgi:hypothetical protein
MDKQSVLKASKEVAIHEVVNVLKKKIPVFGVLYEGYEAYKKSTEEKLFKEFVYTVNDKVQKIEAQFDEEWINSHEGENFCSKVMASAVNAEYCDKQELFANALINGTIVSDIESSEKFKFVDILRQLSRPALDVLAVMYTMRDKIKSQMASMLAENVTNDAHKEGRLKGMDYYLVYSCIEEIKNVGLLSTAITVRKDMDGSYRVATYSDRAESYTDFTQRFIEFVTEKK